MRQTSIFDELISLSYGTPEAKRDDAKARFEAQAAAEEARSRKWRADMDARRAARLEEERRQRQKNSDEYWKRFAEEQKAHRQRREDYERRRYQGLAGGEWRVLGISKTSDREAITKAYRALAKLRHPDVGGNPAMFRELNEEYNAALKHAGRNGKA